MNLLCEVCSLNEFKYKCPGCLKKTCSLDCSKKHKSVDKCDGKNYNPNSYISNETIKSADDENHENNYLVQRDFNFLNNLKRELKIQRDESTLKNKRILQSYTSIRNNNNKNYMVKKPKLDSENNIVIRRGVNCLLVPKGMERSISNKSRWDKSLDLFVWTIEWILCSQKADIDNSVNTSPDTNSIIDSNNMKQLSKHISHKVKENVPLIEGMSNVVYEKCCSIYNITPTLDSDLNKKEFENDMNIKDMLRQNKDRTHRANLLLENNLKFYTKWFDPEQVNILKDSKKLIELNPVDFCIGELFRNKTVIEFPTIYICKEPEDLPSQFEIIKETIVEGEKINKTDSKNEEDLNTEPPAETKTVSILGEQKVNKNESIDSEDDYDPTTN